jgi:secondary thiamine-phosphate synthase enzyme
MLKEFNISTKEKCQLIDITEKVEKTVEESGIKNGLVLVFVIHSTAGILLNENEPGLKEDWLKIFKRITSGIDFAHNHTDNNADAHIIAGLIGNEKTLILEKGRLIRGTWQQIFLVELDGPRNRDIIIKIFQG